MILIIGGIYQGKTTFAKKEFNLLDSQIISGEFVCGNNLENIKCIDNLELLARKCLDENIDVFELIDKIINDNKDMVFVCAEVGCGIVPMDKRDRLYRDMVGKLSSKIADKSEKVIRLFASIPTVLKDTNPRKE
ncbi:MAG: bifunctional adenosylcobinamide kinase/adenosylcobinamide-phosphate guanylyltransferase [Oscillospiraceae bacterium]